MSKKWKVDPCQEGGGGWTVRLDNESEFGDINQDPVATFNRREDADKCVQAHNAHDGLVDTVTAFLVDQEQLKPPFRNEALGEEADELLKGLGK